MHDNEIVAKFNIKWVEQIYKPLFYVQQIGCRIQGIVNHVTNYRIFSGCSYVKMHTGFSFVVQSLIIDTAHVCQRKF